MFDYHRWFPWLNGPAPAAISMTDKEEQDQSSDCSLPSRKTLICHRICPMIGLSTLCFLLLVICIALSVMYADQSSSRPEWNNLITDNQNITENYNRITAVNTHLKRDNKILNEQNIQLEEQTKLLNRTLVKFVSRDLATIEEHVQLMEQITNLTSTNTQLTEENDKLVQHGVKQEKTLVNMSHTITDLTTISNELHEEKQKQAETNTLLKEELEKVKHVNQKLQEDLMKESEQQSELKGQNQNLSSLLEMERTQNEQEKHKIVAEMQSLEEVYHSLERYCPVFNQKTQERVCRKCNESWTLFQRKCYYFSSRSLSWSSSRTWCQTHGADLVIINNEEEQNFIHETSHTVDRTNTRLWIGMLDIEQEGDWCWVDGQQVTSSVQYWLDRPGVGTEPDNWKQDDPEGEDCGHIDSSEEELQSWMDGSCKINYRWICEMNV